MPIPFELSVATLTNWLSGSAKARSFTSRATINGPSHEKKVL
jgi:hypothetical protein